MGLSDLFESNYFWPAHIGSPRGFCSNLHCYNLVEFLEVKYKLWGPPMTWSPLSFYISTYLHSVSWNPSITVEAFLPEYWFLWTWVSIPVSHDSLYLSVCLSMYAAVYPVTSLLMNLERVVDFSVFFTFLLVRNK